MNDMSTRIVADLSGRPARFTADEFMQVFDAAATLDIKLELSDGGLERMSPPSDDHGRNQTLVMTRLVRALGSAADQLLRIEVSVRLSADTVRVPDLLLLGEPSRVKGARDPASLLLVVEVSERTLAKDLGVKRDEYARAGIPFYWVVEGASAVTYVHARPIDGEYRDITVVRFNESLPVPGTDAAITLA